MYKGLSAQEAVGDKIIFTNCNVIDCAGEDLKENMTVIIEGNSNPLGEHFKSQEIEDGFQRWKTGQSCQRRGSGQFLGTLLSIIASIQKK